MSGTAGVIAPPPLIFLAGLGLGLKPMALSPTALLSAGRPRYGAAVPLCSSFQRVLRTLASLLMLVAAFALAPTAMAGGLEASKDTAAIVLASASADADGCVSAAEEAGGESSPDGEHCPACCLHHHGPNGLVAQIAEALALVPSRQPWGEWQPASLLQAPAPVLIQPPRA